MILLNIIVLIIEILFYSLFMKFTRKEGKLWEYVLSFFLVTLFFTFIGTEKIYNYLLLILLMLLNLKYISGLKVNMYDMMIIILMLLSKIVIEGISVLLFYNILGLSIIAVTTIFTILKGAFLVFIYKKGNNMYNSLYKKWSNNDFYIRYLFIFFMLTYTIISITVFING